MSVVSTLRHLALLAVVSAGLSVAAWNGLRHTPWLHDRDRGDVVWVGYARG